MSTAQGICDANPRQSANGANMERLNVDGRLQEEMERLSAINQELLGKGRVDSKQRFDAADGSDDLAHARAENAQLRSRVDELEQALLTSGEADSWGERQKEYESLLEEKSEVIRSLHLKIQEIQEGGGAAPSSPAADQNDLERLKGELEGQRRQLEEDEQSVMQQMRQMEMAMSRDRAELARQRNEVQRLHNELNHEIEIASRDPGLRERLIALQRLQGEITDRKQTGKATAIQPIPKPPVARQEPAAPATGKKPHSGLLKRIFGK